MKGSPAGLARIDRMLGGHAYTMAFTNAPVPFGAFPSLHSGSATMEALMLSYFYPVGVTLYRGTKRNLRLDMRVVYWAYAAWLYWCTMYLMHHYLIDLVAGGCFATICFYLFLPDDTREAMELRCPNRSCGSSALSSTAPATRRPTSAFGVRRKARDHASDPASPPKEHDGLDLEVGLPRDASGSFTVVTMPSLQNEELLNQDEDSGHVLIRENMLMAPLFGNAHSTSQELHPLPLPRRVPSPMPANLAR